MLNMYRMLVHPSSGACDLFVALFHGLCCSGSMCVGVTLWFGWGGVVSLFRLKHCFRLLYYFTIYQPIFKFIPFQNTTLHVSVRHIPDAVCTVLDSWWWTERPSETCRVLFWNEINLKIGSSRWIYYRNINLNVPSYLRCSHPKRLNILPILFRIGVCITLRRQGLP
jgi:hypothetical protein